VIERAQALEAAALQPIDVFLQPGEFFVGDATHRIRTVLGSCVSVTLWNPHKRVGAMSHFMLANRCGAPNADADTATGNPGQWNGKYGDEALALMLRELLRHKVSASQCKAKIFGGGDMFPLQRTKGMPAIGRRNGEAARSLLQAHGIEVVSESLFGEGHRQIVFEVGSGHVWARQLRPHGEASALVPGNTR
jgi:chemotaxis protein CheD